MLGPGQNGNSDMGENMRSIPCGNMLGEGIVWDDQDDRFYWTDIQRLTLWSSLQDGSDLRSIALPARLASFALTDRPGAIVAAFDRAIATFSLIDGRLEWLCQPALPPGVRFNDGRVDRRNRFIVGTMVEDAAAAGGSSLGCLYRLEADGSLCQLLSGIAISNALCFSPDGEELYHTDTPTGQLLAYTYATGVPTSPRLLKQFPRTEGPDGACVDRNGNIWVAIWGGSRIECLTPQGDVVAEIAVEAQQPTCPAFGGADLATLAVTSAWEGLAVSEADRPVGAGDVFLVEACGRGLPEMRVKLG